MLLAPLLGAAGPPPDDVVTVSARLPDAALAVGAEHAIELTVEVAAGWSAADAGIPKIFLQIDPPPSVRLAGKVIESDRELAANEFLAKPFERMIDPGSTSVGFTLDAEPGADEAFALNVVAYVRRGDDGPAWFVRRRVALPVAAGAAGVRDDATRSGWGGDRGGLQIGDEADPFALPRGDGTTVRLADYRGEKNVIVTTYRAFW
jgi:hypothetical protein